MRNYAIYLKIYFDNFVLYKNSGNLHFFTWQICTYMWLTLFKLYSNIRFLHVFFFFFFITDYVSMSYIIILYSIILVK